MNPVGAALLLLALSSCAGTTVGDTAAQDPQPTAQAQQQVPDTGEGAAAPDGPLAAAPEVPLLGGRLTEEQRRVMIYGTGYGEEFSLHKPNYFAVGAHDLKMQLSFKYRFVRDAPAYVSFTNISAWEIDEDSNPNRDIDFNPEVFYRWRVRTPVDCHVDTGYWHMSNGVAGSNSRNWDRLFVRGIFEGRLLGRPLVATPAGYYTLTRSDPDVDLGKYLGSWDAGFLWSDLLYPDAPGNDLDLYVDVVGGKRSLTVGLQYRLEEYRFNPNLYLQLFTGYGDTQLEYNERKTELRLGMSFY